MRGERPLWDFPSGLARREVAAYELSKALGWELVPPTVMRDGPDGRGLACSSSSTPTSASTTSPCGRTSATTTPSATCAPSTSWPTATDRKGGHCLVDGDGHIWAIDNGLSFHHEFKVRTVIWDFAGERLPDDLAADLQTLVTGASPTSWPSCSTPSSATPC